MTARQRTIIKAILDACYGMDGALLAESVLHAEVNLRISPTSGKSEFDDALTVADNNGWLIRVNSKFGKGVLWKISEGGEAARLEMR